MRKSFLIGLCLLLVMVGSVSAAVYMNMSLTAGPSDVYADDLWWCQYIWSACDDGAGSECETMNATYSKWVYNSSASNAYLISTELILWNASDGSYGVKEWNNPVPTITTSDRYYCQLDFVSGGSNVSQLSNYIQLSQSGGGGVIIDEPGTGGGVLVQTLRDYYPDGYDRLSAAFEEWVAGEDFNHFFISFNELMKALVSYVFKQPGTLIPPGVE